MALIVDPDLLLDDSDAGDSAQNIFINTSLRTIKIRNNAGSPDPSNLVLDNDGVTHQALYSFLKEEWKNDPKGKNLIAYPFPLVAITPEQFEWRFGWSPADDSSRSLIRTGGWREYATDNSIIKREYVGVISLGNIQGTPREEEAGVVQHKAYYAFFDDTTKAPLTNALDFDYSGEVNQAVLKFLDSDANGVAETDFNNEILRVFIRSTPYEAPQAETAWTFDQTDTIDIGISAGTLLPYNVQRFPLAEGTDLNVLERVPGNLSTTRKLEDANIDETIGGKYEWGANGPSIEYLGTNVSTSTLGYTQDLANGSISIGNVINAQSPTVTNLSTQETYGFVQFKLRQDSDIEFAAGTNKVGRLQDELLQFVGPTLVTKRSTNQDQSGAFLNTAITNFLSTDVNNIEFTDSNGVQQPFPFSAGVTISFSEQILADSDNAKVFVYYDYTKNYTGTSIQLSAAGPSAANSLLDSVTVTLSSDFVGPLAGIGADEGLELVNGNRHFRLNGMDTASNNRPILELIAEFDSFNFSARAIDDDAVLSNETTTGASLRTHPINSPSAILIDSAGTAVENTGGVTAVLGTGGIYAGTDGLNASDQLVFSYDFTNNSQKDRVGGTAVPVVVRAIGLSNGSFVETNATIGENDDNPISVISAVERNYNNPV